MDDAIREEKQVEYLFLDIEWNQAPGTIELGGREAIQIAAVAVDAEMQKIKTFSKAIKMSNPERFNKKTEKITHTPLETIMQGKSEDIVLKNFAQTFSQYRYIVVWTKETYELFKRDMQKNGVPMKRRTVIILQEILEIIASGGKKIGFEEALQCAGIEYIPNYLHYSKHDANYLYHLFECCYQQYKSTTAGENCIENIVTKKLHTENCRYMKNMQPERTQIVCKELIFKGFTVCKCCGKGQVWTRLKWNCKRKEDGKDKTQNRECRSVLRNLALTDENIERICKRFQLSYSISNDAVFIRTAFARWIVYLQDSKVKKLFHENYRSFNSQSFKKQKMKCMEGYHKQKLPSDNFFEVVEYIKYHDIGTVKRMSKKSRIERLFEKVELELKSKKLQKEEYVDDNVAE